MASEQPRSPHAELREALREAGFIQTAHRLGCYTRWCWPETDHTAENIIVPEDPPAPEHEELMLAAITKLTDAVKQGARAQQALNRLRFWELYFAFDQIARAAGADGETTP